MNLKNSILQILDWFSQFFEFFSLSSKISWGLSFSGWKIIQTKQSNQDCAISSPAGLHQEEFDRIDCQIEVQGKFREIQQIPAEIKLDLVLFLTRLTRIDRRIDFLKDTLKSVTRSSSHRIQKKRIASFRERLALGNNKLAAESPRWIRPSWQV